MLLTSEQLKQIMPTLPKNLREQYLPWLNLAMARFLINTELRISMFLAQLAHESNNLTRWSENLDYRAERLTQVWPKRFPTLALAAPYAHNPRVLADKVYNGRMGNRLGTDDGYNYRGAGPLQATGREMFEALTDGFGKEFGVDFVANPELLLQAKFGFLAAAYIFAIEKHCNSLADARKIVECTERINGGTTGLAERKANWERALRVLPDDFKLDSFEVVDAALEHSAIPVAVNGDYTTETTDFDNHYDAPKEPAPDTATASAGDDQNAPAGTNQPPATENGTSAGNGASDGTQAAPVELVKQRPSIYVKVFAAFTFLTGIGFNVVNMVETKIDAMTPNQFAIVLGGIALIAFALWFYDRSGQRSNHLNDKLITAANNKGATVNLVKSATAPATA